MKQRYIDFVPAKGKKPAKKPVAAKPVKKAAALVKPVAKPAVRKPVAAVKPVVKPVVKPTVKPTSEMIEELSIEEIFAERSESANLGVIEDFRPKFVSGAEVKKRPLGKKPAAKPIRVKAGAAKPAAVRAGAVKSAMKPGVAKPGAVKPGAVKPGARPLRPAFVNVNKIEKRPLSGGTYPRRRAVPVYKKEEPKGPEKIITKPEKDSNAGLIITIVVTIILGAAAGTVAFLLLPK